MPPLSRRQMMASGAATLLAMARPAAAGIPALTLTRRTLEVQGKPAAVLGICGPDGRPGLTLPPGARFAYTVRNQCGAASIVHWHGQTPPPGQDGVTDTGYAPPIAPGGSQAYDFVPRPGTHWMHSHQALQEAQLMAAPLIVHGPEDERRDAQEVVVLLQDFSRRDPAQILAGLTAKSGGMAGMNMGGMDMGSMNMAPDLNDIDFDAYLANDHTLDDPQIIRAAPGAQILLRLINGATATGFWIDLGGVPGQLLAVDGDPVRPVSVSRLPLACAQRVDILLRLPGAGAFPILAQREGAVERTGIIIATPGAKIAKRAGTAGANAAACDLSLEARLGALTPLPARQPDQVFQLHLTGGMAGYDWGINGRQWGNRQPLMVKPGQRIAFDLINDGMMAHPMHLHGHHFQLTGINGTAFAGAMRDTVLVPPMASLRIAFDAANPGRWLFHCHNLFHMAAGMMTELVYS